MIFQLLLRTYLGFRILSPWTFMICPIWEWLGGHRGASHPAPCCWPWPCMGSQGGGPEQDNANSDASLVFSVCGTGTSQAECGVFNSSGWIWPITSKLCLNLYCLTVSPCKEFPSLGKKKKVYRSITYFFSEHANFWFHMMPQISKRGEKNWKKKKIVINTESDCQFNWIWFQVAWSHRYKQVGKWIAIAVDE